MPLAVTSPQTGFASFPVAHGLGAAPLSVEITMTSGGEIWLDATLGYDGTYVYLHASAPGITALLNFNLEGFPGGTGGTYTTVDQVGGLFPTFKRGTPQQNPPDSLIQTFINDVGAEINSVLLRRFSESIGAPTNLAAWLGALPLATGAANILERINRYGAAVQLAGVLSAYGVSGVAKLAAQIEATYERLFGNLNARLPDGKPMPAGPYDHLFDPLAKTESPRPAFEGIAGAETDRSTPEDRGENRAFGRNQVF